ncbi:MAG: TIGR02444 family protein [Gammaproteobacteria bacterium]|nr:TIGR02444 family protein [Gammaproteobacteria bacterium]
MNFPDSEFWNFSTQIYQQAEVESACLHLQNTYDADINILLYCCWAGEQAFSLSTDDIRELIQTAHPWQTNILKPLRDARSMMKQHIIAMPAHMIEQTVNNMSEMELNAEHMAQLAMEKAIALNNRVACENKSAIECSIQNLSAYIQQLESVSSINEVMHDLSNLLNGIFQDAEAIQLAFMNTEIAC